MALNAATLQAAIVTALTTEFGTDYQNIPDDHQLPDFDNVTYWNRYWSVVSIAIINHFTTLGRATGVDVPSGDTHNLNIV